MDHCILQTQVAALTFGVDQTENLGTIHIVQAPMREIHRK